MNKKIAIAAIGAVLLAGLVAAMHHVSLADIIRRIHGV